MMERRLRRMKWRNVIVGFVLVFLLFWLLKSPSERFDLEPKSEDITLVTHLSLDRLKALELILSNWAGPVAISFWLKDMVLEHPKVEEVESKLKGLPRVSYCFFSSSKYTYPANILRNRALQLVETKMVFLLDADFVPDGGLYGYLRSNFVELYSGWTVYVVPAFQFAEDNPSYSGQTESFHFPKGKGELLGAVREGKMMPMFQGIDDTPSIRATNINKWYGAEETYSINYEEDYEPYIVAPTEFIPPYDERFLYYGYDKIQHIYHLYYKGFAFKVIPEHFIVHYPHHRSNWGNQQSKDAHKVKLLMQQFKNDLRDGRL
jgi:glycosyltransferase-like protein LARGE